MSPSPLCSVNTLATAGGVDVVAGTTVTVQLLDMSANSWTLAVVGVDDTQAMPGPALSINNTTRTATFTAPGNGTALRFLTTAYDAQQKAYQATFSVYVRTLGGKRVIALGETTEGDSQNGWTTPVNAAIRGSSGALFVIGASGTTTLDDADETLFVDTTSAAQTVRLPPSPTNGRRISVKAGANANTHNVTVNGNGHNIDAASTYTMNVAYGGAVFVYVKDLPGWAIVAKF
jgi:hypothetical protein